MDTSAVTSTMRQLITSALLCCGEDVFHEDEYIKATARTCGQDKVAVRVARLSLEPTKLIEVVDELWENLNMVSFMIDVKPVTTLEQFLMQMQFVRTGPCMAVQCVPWCGGAPGSMFSEMIWTELGLPGIVADDMPGLAAGTVYSEQGRCKSSLVALTNFLERWNYAIKRAKPCGRILRSSPDWLYYWVRTDCNPAGEK